MASQVVIHLPKKLPAKFSMNDFKEWKNLKEEQGFHEVNIYSIIDDKTVGAQDGLLGFSSFTKGGTHKPHIHKFAEEYMIITKGRGLVRAGDQEWEVKAGDIIYVPRNCVHSDIGLDDKEPYEGWFIYAGAPSLKKSGYVPMKNMWAKKT